MKKLLAMFLSAAMMLSLLCVSAFAGSAYNSLTHMDQWGRSATFSAARVETRTLQLSMFGETNTVHATLYLLQPGSTVLALNAEGEEDYVTATGYTRTGDNTYDVVEALMPGYVTGSVDGLFGTFEGCTIDMLELGSEYDENGAMTNCFFMMLDDGAAPAEPEAPAFSDVKKGIWYENAVAWAVEKKITGGTGNNQFSPMRKCTNSEILTFIWRAMDKPASSGSNPFTDVSTGDFFYDAALWGAENDMVSGNTLDPKALCTRAETVTYLWKMVGSPAAAPSTFTDVPADAPYAQAVAWAVANGVTTGAGNNTFNPDGTCSRAEIVTFLMRAVG